jgi:cell division protein FtsB
MKKINFRRLYYHVRHKYVVVLAAFVIAASWVWGSLGVMQRNYDLQKQLDLKQRQLQLTQIQTSSLQLEQRYYQTAEYQELAARADLGLVKPGEKLLILPPNSAAVKAADAATTIQTIADLPQQSNVQQWVNFLFGGDVKPTSSNS